MELIEFEKRDVAVSARLLGEARNAGSESQCLEIMQ
jgi:hypothetical protein